MQNGDTIGVFFLTQCWVNGWPRGLRNDDNTVNNPRLTFDVRDGVVKWYVEDNRIRRTAKDFAELPSAPIGWADRQRNFYDAQRVFR